MSNELRKIVFELKKDADGYPPLAAESLWALKQADGSYKVDNIPFYARGVSLGDLVSVGENGGALVFTGIVARSGNSTFRAFIPEDLTRKSIMDAIKKIGGFCEVSEVGELVAISAPRECRQEVADALDNWRQSGLLDYEAPVLRK